MANTKRRAEYIDRNGNMFIPMNVEGNADSENFITTPKFLCIVGIIVMYVILVMYLGSANMSFLGYVIFLGGWTVISFYLLRFVVFEEKFYYRMYLELKDKEISTPALFWDIASIKDTEDGALVTYSDARIGVMVRVDRDTITGKEADFKELHYDAISDFYREVVNNRYSFVQMNVMEQAGKDPRLNNLNKLVNNSDNKNINKLMELEIGYIKNITRMSLYETDYFIIYTSDISKRDYIMNDVTDCMFKLLDGAYVGYTIMNSKEIVDFVKSQYGVNYFNATEASMDMFNRNATNTVAPFNITGIRWNNENNEEQELTAVEINKLKSQLDKVLNDVIPEEQFQVHKLLYRAPVKEKIGIDFDSLGEAKTLNNVSNRNRTVKPQAQLNKQQNNKTQSNVNSKPNQQQKPSLQKQNLQKQPNNSQQHSINNNQQMMNNMNRQNQNSNNTSGFNNTDDEDGFIDL
jgi:hypothetical protein